MPFPADEHIFGLVDPFCGASQQRPEGSRPNLSLHEAQQSTRKQQFLDHRHRLAVAHFPVRQRVLKCSDRPREEISHPLTFRYRQRLVRQFAGIGIERFAHQLHSH